MHGSQTLSHGTCASAGESFLGAGRNVTDLLRRNFLKAYGVWWFPPLVIQMGAFVLSAAWGLALYGATYFALGHHAQGHQVSGGGFGV